MPKFEMLKSNNDLKEIIKSAFNSELDISGSWGYTHEFPTIIHSTNDTPLIQLQHIFATMRAYIEMNMTQKKETRYASINLKENSRERISIGDCLYDKVSYTITAMKEDTYTKFINEYKEGYGKKNFNLSEHFKQREKATLRRDALHWFEVTSIVS